MAENWIKEIQKRVKEIPLASGRSKKWGKISFDDLVFVPAQLAKRPVDYYREKIRTRTVLGKLSKKPIEIETPIIIGAMSFGATNRETKTALALASRIASTCENTGEGGMLSEERKYSKCLIAQYASGRFGVDEEYFKKADAIEIKIGQGAKAGAGGFLPGFKVSQEIAKIRKVPVGQDIHSPAAHLDIKTLGDLRKKIEKLRKITEGKPIILKLGAPEAGDVRLAVKANPDIIAIDGMEGGCGFAPEVLMDEVGIPTIPALVRARKVLDEMGARQELWIGGGLNKGGDMAKALALGADAVFVATSLLIALGAPYSISSFKKQSKPIVLPDVRPELVEKAQKVANFIKNCTEEIKIITGAVGKNDVQDLSKDDLRALTSEMAKITGVKLC